jgi:hypothetical protein
MKIYIFIHHDTILSGLNVRREGNFPLSYLVNVDYQNKY